MDVPSNGDGRKDVTKSNEDNGGYGSSTTHAATAGLTASDSFGSVGTKRASSPAMVHGSALGPSVHGGPVARSGASAIDDVLTRRVLVPIYKQSSRSKKPFPA